MRSRPASATRGRRVAALAAAGLAVVAAISVYSGTLSHGFVFDDYPLVVRNPVLRDARNLVPLLGLDGSLPAPRALRTVLDLFDFARGGGAPRAFHETSVALHAIATALVFALVRKLAPRGFAAAAAALAFALHPIHADAVAFVSGRKDVLATSLALASLLAFLRHRETRGIASGALALAFFLLALLAKEMAAALPLVALALDAALPDPATGRPPGVAGALRARPVAHGAAFALALAAGAAAVFVYEISSRVGSGVFRPIGGSLGAHALTVARVAVLAAGSLFLPVRLRGDYSYAALEPSVGFGLAEAGAIAAVAALALGVVGLRRRAPLAGALATSAGLAYLPVAQILPHHEIFSEHTLYLPSVFACALFGLAAARAAERAAGTGRRALALAAPAALLVLFASRAADRAADYRDTETWCRSILRVAPECARARYNLGEALRLASRRDEAEREYLRAAEIGSRDPAAASNLASAWNQAGLVRFLAWRERAESRDLDLAIERFSRSVEAAPRETTPRVNLATALLEKGDLAGAERAAAGAPDRLGASYHLASIAAICRARGGAGADAALASAVAAFDLAESRSQRDESARLVIRALVAAGEPESVVVALRCLRRAGADGAPTGERERAAFGRDTRRAARARLEGGTRAGEPESEWMRRLRAAATAAIGARRERRGAGAATAADGAFWNELAGGPRAARP